MGEQAKILIVDDEPFNVDYLEQELEDLGYDTVSAPNGRVALEQVDSQAPDMILLDIMMPEMDGFQVLEHLKADKTWRDIPVIVISAMDDIDSVVRGVELGAEDYLPKPFDPVLLQARINAGLEKKRFRDQEVEYLRQVEMLTDAATAVEADTFDAESLSSVAERGDALGHLARVFLRMAREVHAREQRLKQQIEQLRLDVEERRVTSAQTAAVYVPMDRRHALVSEQDLPEKTRGAALFADVSGSVPLTAALAEELGPNRGAEELTRQLDRVYGALIDEVHRYGGSVVNFSGDAITCWFDTNTSHKTSEVNSSPEADTSVASPRIPGEPLKTVGLHAIACALAMQTALGEFGTVITPAQTAISLGIKVTVVAGPARRLLVGDPKIQQIEALVGDTVDELAIGENLANRGDILVQAALAADVGQAVAIEGWRSDEATGKRFALVTSLNEDVDPAPWIDSHLGALSDEQVRPWLLAPVYDMVRNGRGGFLAELRPATSLFLKFDGLDYNQDDEVRAKLDRFIRWVQTVLARHEGYLVQLTFGDKGSYLQAAFGAPVGLEDHAFRAVVAALDLQTPPEMLGFFPNVRIGLASGQMRVGPYGSQVRRAYGLLGDKTNLAARLMQASEGRILCDEAVYQGARAHLSFDPLPSMMVKGKAEPVAIYSPSGESDHSWHKNRIDELAPGPQLTLKVASLIGSTFAYGLLQAVYPVEADKESLREHLAILEEHGMIKLRATQPEPSYCFSDADVQESAYSLMLFAQRRQLHRTVAEWHEQIYADDIARFYPLLAHHWRRADEPEKAIYYLEKAAEQARRNGEDQGALRFLDEALEIEAHASVLSDEYRTVINVEGSID
jgi:DNA-binding response OmpR family regulator